MLMAGLNSFYIIIFNKVCAVLGVRVNIVFHYVMICMYISPLINYVRLLCVTLCIRVYDDDNLLQLASSLCNVWRSHTIKTES